MPPIRCFLGGIDDLVHETDASPPRKRWTQGCRNAERALLLCVGMNLHRPSVDNCSTWTVLNRLTLKRLPVLVFLQWNLAMQDSAVKLHMVLTSGPRLLVHAPPGGHARVSRYHSG